MQMAADLVENKFEPHLLIQGEFSKKAILEKHINLRQQKSLPPSAFVYLKRTIPMCLD
jgi:hypothetical protein